MPVFMTTNNKIDVSINERICILQFTNSCTYDLPKSILKSGYTYNY